MYLLFLQTGGTIDKDYPRQEKGWAFEIGPPAVKRILEKLDPSFTYEIRQVLRKDSLEITEEDRALILETCRNHQAEHIIITHGTDTMRETAFHLSDLTNKTIVLTGAMRPERFSDSDAPITVGMAIAAVQSLPHGVYIAMHGIVKRFDKIGRDHESGRYE